MDEGEIIWKSTEESEGGGKRKVGKEEEERGMLRKTNVEEQGCRT